MPSVPREPFGGTPAKTELFRYGMLIAQKHAARRLHYDFWLQMEDVLHPWAVPEALSLDPHERGLAVMVAYTKKR